MMDTVGHHLYFMMLCVGMADGYTSDEEKEVCKTRASEQVARLCERDGWDKYDIIDKKEQGILTEAASYLLTSIQTNKLWDNFGESVKMMPPSLNYDQALLNDLYEALKNVAEADISEHPVWDGAIDMEEHNVLEFVYAEWGLVRYGELHRS
jgi:hypothetical protein